MELKHHRVVEENRIFQSHFQVPCYTVSGISPRFWEVTYDWTAHAHAAEQLDVHDWQ